MTESQTWSEWLEYNKENISKVPQRPGVFKMHTAMKMLYIGEAQNLQSRLDELLKAPCTSEAKRFSYMETPNFRQVNDQLLTDFKERHQGKLPRCMENN